MRRLHFYLGYATTIALDQTHASLFDWEREQKVFYVQRTYESMERSGDPWGYKRPETGRYKYMGWLGKFLPTYDVLYLDSNPTLRSPLW